MIAGKVWGSTELLVAKPTFDARFLNIKPHAQCSLHAHGQKWNGFLVFSGRLKIEVHKNDYPLVDVTELGPGDYTEVKPGEFHRFIAGADPVVAVEWYYADIGGAVREDDIIRKDCGSVLETECQSSKPSRSAHSSTRR